MEYSIDVILTLYKKPDVLEKQLKAIKKQTIVPNNIFLYQDGIDSYYRIELKNEIKEQFTDIYAPGVNYGVWKRFEYARNISKAKYVAIFDDDTIPGSKWLENCLKNIQVNLGVYGTNGVLLAPNSKYPFVGFTNVGWHNPNEKVYEVDLLGHAWFLETKWLDFMFEDYNSEIKEYKYVGEDMYLSYKCLEHGIKSYVPPHPYNDLELWGSLPEYGNKFGISEVAISCNSDNLKCMNKFWEYLKDKGWKTISDRDVESYTILIQHLSKLKRDYVCNELINASNKYSNTYIYGIGRYASIIKTFMDKMNISVKGFIISNGQELSTDEFLGKPVNFVNDVLESGEEKNIVLALNEINHKDIINNLLSYNNIEIYPKENKIIPYSEKINLISNLI